MESSFSAWARCDGKQNNRQCFSEGINGIIRNYNRIGETGARHEGRRDLLLLLQIELDAKYVWAASEMSAGFCCC